MERRKLEDIEHYIFSLFSSRNSSRLLTREIFESTQKVANADLVRAFEDLEKRWRFLVRYTKDGSDWISLTPQGAFYAGVTNVEDHLEALPHPPRSTTSTLAKA